MRDRLKYLSWVATPLLFYFISLSLAEIVLSSSVASAQEATTGDRNTRGDSAEQMTQRDRLFQTGVEQFHKGQLREALATFQQVRALSQERGDKLGEAATYFKRRRKRKHKLHKLVTKKR